MKKTFILDTNVLLHDVNCLHAFEDNDIIIPMAVIEELDSFKSESDTRGKNARMVSRALDDMRKVGRLNEGVKLAVKGEATAEGLEEFIARGGKVLVCGICLKHFNLEGQTVGTVSNMFEIFEQLTNHNSLVL